MFYYDSYDTNYNLCFIIMTPDDTNLFSYDNQLLVMFSNFSDINTIIYCIDIYILKCNCI